MLRIGIIGDLESRGKAADPGLPRKRPLKRCVWGGGALENVHFSAF